MCGRRAADRGFGRAVIPKIPDSRILGIPFDLVPVRDLPKMQESENIGKASSRVCGVTLPKIGVFSYLGIVLKAPPMGVLPKMADFSDLGKSVFT